MPAKPFLVGMCHGYGITVVNYSSDHWGAGRVRRQKLSPASHVKFVSAQDWDQWVSITSLGTVFLHRIWETTRAEPKHGDNSKPYVSSKPGPCVLKEPLKIFISTCLDWRRKIFSQWRPTQSPVCLLKVSSMSGYEQNSEILGECTGWNQGACLGT